ncbi:MAG: hypothetical protein HQL05_10595 [Nitrospirae bacterium]|uniref:hypothetical protein n=1 Tax=Candidatus Magnetobacterium casense TaxID=1455061 RepID=UPI0012DC7A53|nr:hypothetical protein [Candidatus Magnetobacterium casensis]MBF0338267.1 hypothetical protein [Nitrospirota bacterium]
MKIISIRLNEEDIKHLKLEASKLRLTLSALIRIRALGFDLKNNGGIIDNLIK